MMKFAQPDFDLVSEGSNDNNDYCEGCGQDKELTAVYTDVYRGELLCDTCLEAQSTSFRNELLNNACNE